MGGTVRDLVLQYDGTYKIQADGCLASRSPMLPGNHMAAQRTCKLIRIASPQRESSSPLRGELVQGSTRRIRLAGWKECIAVRERLPYSKHVYAVVPCIERKPIVEPCPTASAPPNLPNLASTESVHPTRLSHTLST